VVEVLQHELSETSKGIASDPFVPPCPQCCRRICNVGVFGVGTVEDQSGDVFGEDESVIDSAAVASQGWLSTGVGRSALDWLQRGAMTEDGSAGMGKLSLCLRL
jgi:hypothetical protein